MNVALSITIKLIQMFAVQDANPCDVVERAHVLDILVALTPNTH